MNWQPFHVTTETPLPRTRPMQTPEGISDRIRAAAFAEIQAREAFLWAAETFQDASENLKQAWRQLAKAEDKHLNWLLNRLSELGFSPEERPVSDHLWQSFMICKSAEQFAHFMANAEERGRIAGERFYESLISIDPISAEIFRKIAEEELEHIALAQQFFPKTN